MGHQLKRAELKQHIFDCVNFAHPWPLVSKLVRVTIAKAQLHMVPCRYIGSTIYIIEGVRSSNKIPYMNCGKVMELRESDKVTMFTRLSPG